MNEKQENYAPGWPGIPARWTSSAKSGVGTSLSASSRVWFTISHGILNEIYYPRVDLACTRDMGLIITDGRDFFSEEKRHAGSLVSRLADGIPAYKLVNTCLKGNYEIAKEVLTDPSRDVLLQNIRFTPLNGTLKDYHLYVLLAPHVGNRGSGNTAWTGDYKGTPMLFAQREGIALALACSAPWLKLSVGFVGVSDGWQDLMLHREMQWTYGRAENGNVALTGEVELNDSGGAFQLALGFGRNPAEAGQHALASMLEGFDAARSKYISQWQSWQDSLFSPAETAGENTVFRTSAAILRIHEAKRLQGGIIASLSIPWGFVKGDDDLGGYHLVWPRDLVETAGALLSMGAAEDARRVILYLQCTQEADGNWPQNMWLDGTPYWSGIQMDETAFPVLLVDMARRLGVLDGKEISRLWPMIRKAAGFLVRNGPVSQQDRWEEDHGYSPFTLSVEIAALLAAAELADLHGDTLAAGYLRETADTWNDNIDRWVYKKDTDLSRQMGIEGYYVRISPPEVSDAASPLQGFVPIKNRPPGQSAAPASHIISPDALALVRFGLRAPDDARVTNTLKVIDALLKVETPFGPSWHRYNEDGYGEHNDGSPFDGTGRGRAWPLLTGERAHYELAAGRADNAIKLRKTLESFSSSGLISEQIWDSADIPQRELFTGRPSGSAMPLVWAHAEYLKLRRSLHDGRVFDMPPQTVKRYLDEKITSPYASWRFNQKCRVMPKGKTLRIEALSPSIVRWTSDGWRSFRDDRSNDTGLGLHLVDLPTKNLPSGSTVEFTFHWTLAGRWEDMNYHVDIV